MMQMIPDISPMTATLFQASPQPQSSWTLFLPMAIIFLIFYLLLIRPQSKKQKALQKMISELKSGDRIITTGGIHGTVAGITDELIQLKVGRTKDGDPVKIEISRNAVAALQNPKEG